MFDAVYKLAQSNRQVPHLQGFRIKDGVLMATNIVTSIYMQDTRLNGLDCYVDAQTFIGAYRGTKASPMFTKIPNGLRLTDGAFEIDVPTRDAEAFPDLDTATGESFEVPTFLEDIKHVRSFLRNTKDVYCASLAYIMGGYVFWSDSMMLIRSKLAIPYTKPIILTKEFIDLCVELKQEPLSINVDKDTFTLWTDTGWIHTFQDTQEAGLDFLAYTAKLDKHPFTPLEETLKTDLKRLCDADPNGVVVLDETGASLIGKSKSRVKNAQFPKKKLSARLLKKVLMVADCIDWSYESTVIAFSGKGLQGVLSTQ